MVFNEAIEWISIACVDQMGLEEKNKNGIKRVQDIVFQNISMIFCKDIIVLWMRKKNDYWILLKRRGEKSEEDYSVIDRG